MRVKQKATLLEFLARWPLTPEVQMKLTIVYALKCAKGAKA